MVIGDRIPKPQDIVFSWILYFLKYLNLKNLDFSLRFENLRYFWRNNNSLLHIPSAAYQLQNKHYKNSVIHQLHQLSMTLLYCQVPMPTVKCRFGERFRVMLHRLYATTSDLLKHRSGSNSVGEM